jgi:hypothetical protein
MDTNVETTEADVKREFDSVPPTDKHKTIITSTTEIVRFGGIMANAKRMRGTDLSGLTDAELLSALTS